MHDNFKDWVVRGTVDGETQEQAMMRLGREFAGRMNRVSHSSVSPLVATAPILISARNLMPVDRTQCVVVSNGRYELAYFTTQFGWTFHDKQNDERDHFVTHWIPLPTLPALEEQQ